MDRIELTSTYTPISAESAKPFWDELYTSTLSSCIHRGTCALGEHCTHGRRITKVTLLSGSVVRVWGVLEAVLKRHEWNLNKADRGMRITRVDMGAEGLIVGVRFKDTLLPEVCSQPTGYTRAESTLPSAMQHPTLQSA